MDKVQLKTMYSMLSSNIYASLQSLRLGFRPRSTYTFPISACVCQPDNNFSDQVWRLQGGNTKFYCQSTRTLVSNQELMQAIFNKDIEKIT